MTMTDYRSLVETAHAKIEDILNWLNIEHHRTSDGFRACCPIKNHGGDRNKLSFSWSRKYNGWMCWSWRCNDEYGRNAIGLVRGIFDCSEEEAISKLEQFLQGKLLSNDELEIIRRKRHEYVVKIEKQEIMPDVVLKYLDYNTKFHNRMCKKHGISMKQLKRYNVGYWYKPKTALNHRLVVPIRDIDSNIVGFAGRSCLEKEDLEKYGLPKWKFAWHYAQIIGADIERKKVRIKQNLFNIHNASAFTTDFIVVDRK